MNMRILTFLLTASLLSTTNAYCPDGAEDKDGCRQMQSSGALPSPRTAPCPADSQYDDSCDILNGLMVEQVIPNVNDQLQTSLPEEVWFSDDNPYGSFLPGEFVAGDCSGQSATVAFSFRKITGLTTTSISAMNPAALDDATCGRGFWIRRPPCGFDMTYSPMELSAPSYSLWVDLKVSTPSGSCSSRSSARIEVSNPQFSTTAHYNGEINRDSMLLQSASYDPNPSVEIDNVKVDHSVDAYEDSKFNVDIETTEIQGWTQDILAQEVFPRLEQAAITLNNDGGTKDGALLTVDLDRNTAISARRQIYWNHIGSVLTFESLAARAASPFVFVWCAVFGCDDNPDWAPYDGPDFN